MDCNRADYLERTIVSVLKYQSSVTSKYPLFISQILKLIILFFISNKKFVYLTCFNFVLHAQQTLYCSFLSLKEEMLLTVIVSSQDGSDPNAKAKALSFFNQLTYMQHIDYDPLQTERPGELIAYYKIARHYKWALDELFYKHNFDRVIILEDDMEIAPDFFDYFEAAAALLDKDKLIMAVSSWNDNGQKQFVYDPYFFPGLGWMLTKSTWNELSPNWPKAYPS
ncbi:alpha-1,3-mannosyl-glycoprotein 2-beta-N-acetylglucosaminyltransferase-like [Hibiscus syriacus]|uniref:alpha-1,3-mannosyl-glycoprotein 2-beta-N-acetylglucosaminyltransferase-like n=1 Tax=Hibiscus syriacus TaxID=106335 RepID=UPI0019209C31|nr:alpha-1,3-mannosyl-glycoprotein 2-beta-N-acetylglucosaminyltransferase-like [Hibiscus syriacus]